MTWAMGRPVSNAGQKLVLLMLANHSNFHTGQCNPSHKLLANECAMGISTLKGHIQALEDFGYLTIVPKYSDGVQLPNQYKLNFDGVGQNLAGGGSESDWGGGQNLATNLEDKPRIGSSSSFNQKIAPKDVSDEVWQEFVAHRKAKKARVTPLVIDSIAKQAAKAGWTLENALKEVVVRNWQSFNADWVAGKDKATYSPMKGIL